jgi:hypothetical protein
VGVILVACLHYVICHGHSDDSVWCKFKELSVPFCRLPSSVNRNSVGKSGNKVSLN